MALSYKSLSEMTLLERGSGLLDQMPHRSKGHKDGAVSTRCRVKKVIYNLIIQTRP